MCTDFDNVYDIYNTVSCMCTDFDNVYDIYNTKWIGPFLVSYTYTEHYQVRNAYTVRKDTTIVI